MLIKKSLNPFSSGQGFRETKKVKGLDRDELMDVSIPFHQGKVSEKDLNGAIVESDIRPSQSLFIRARFQRELTPEQIDKAIDKGVSIPFHQGKVSEGIDSRTDR